MHALKIPSTSLMRSPRAGKTGGVYVPPFKLARMMAESNDDRASPEYQRLTWEALKKSLNGIINKVNTTNIKAILLEVFREVRPSCLFVRMWDRDLGAGHGPDAPHARALT